MKKIYSIYQIALRSFTADGTLESARELLPYLAENGFDIIYLCPVFEADADPDTVTWSPRQRASGTYNPANPYKMRDYFKVDAEYGTNDDLKLFIDTAHALGLRVMLDLVYLHCGKNAVFVKEHPEYLICDDSGKPIVGADWPFARLNFENAALREYLYSNMEYYVRDFGIDGFRCDVGDQVPLDFWREGIARVKRINPDIIMLNEGQKLDYNEVFDICYMSYELARIAKSDTPAKVLSDMRYDDYFGHRICFIENHDIASNNQLTRYEKTAGHELSDLTFVLLYTIEGVPFVFNGNEIADSSEQCMFSNRFHGKRAGIDWSNLNREYGKRRLALIRELNALRRQSNALLFGRLTIADATENNVLLFTRTYENESVTVAVNTGKECRSFDFDSENYDIKLSHNADICKERITLGRYGYAILINK